MEGSTPRRMSERNLRRWRIVDLIVQVAEVVLIEALILDSDVVVEDLKVPSIGLDMVTALGGDPSGSVVVVVGHRNGWVLQWQ